MKCINLQRPLEKIAAVAPTTDKRAEEIGPSSYSPLPPSLPLPPPNRRIGRNSRSGGPIILPERPPMFHTPDIL